MAPARCSSAPWLLALERHRASRRASYRRHGEGKNHEEQQGRTTRGRPHTHAAAAFFFPGAGRADGGAPPRRPPGITFRPVLHIRKNGLPHWRKWDEAAHHPSRARGQTEAITGLLEGGCAAEGPDGPGSWATQAVVPTATCRRGPRAAAASQADAGDGQVVCRAPCPPPRRPLLGTARRVPAITLSTASAAQADLGVGFRGWCGGACLGDAAQNPRQGVGGLTAGTGPVHNSCTALPRLNRFVRVGPRPLRGGWGPVSGAQGTASTGDEAALRQAVAVVPSPRAQPESR